MSKWDGCPIIACKNDLCHDGCQVLKGMSNEKLEAIAKIIDPAPWGSPFSYPIEWEGDEDVQAAKDRAFAKAEKIADLLRS